LGYLPFSVFPQKTMPGYGGTSFAGFMLATLAILSTTKVGTALVVLGVPLIDAVYVGTRRILEKKSPFRGDNKHLHHRLLELGWSKRSIALFYWVVTAILGFVALNLNSSQKLITMLVISIGLGGFLIWISFGRFLKQPDQDNG
jgi:UDP-GlcNAc:undecaprenyl-phosphate GlcNAc-1-phosphate transferase